MFWGVSKVKLAWCYCNVAIRFLHKMTSSNGPIFRVTGPLCGEFTGHRWISRTKQVTRSVDVFFDLCLNNLLSKQSSGWGFETASCSVWRHCVMKQNVHIRPIVHPWRRCDMYRVRKKFDPFFLDSFGVYGGGHKRKGPLKTTDLGNSYHIS